MNCRLLMCALMAVVTFSGVLTADSQGRGRGKGNDKDTAPAVSVSAVVVFRDSDRVTFRDYFVRNRITAQPLPPGIAKNVARGKPLPPGIAKKALPAGLIAIGPRVGSDVSFAIVGDVVIAQRGGVVIDVMVGLFK